MNPLPPMRVAARASHAAFTLLELVAMLAVLAVLITVTASALFTRVREAHRQSEAVELDRLAGLWPGAFRRSRSLPSADQWTAWLATNTPLPIWRIALNGSGLHRQLIFDPAMSLGRPPAATPFVQDGSGSLTPVQPRLILASGLTDALPDLRSLDFEALWTNAPDRWPSGWPAGWAGEAADLRLARVDLRDQFRRLILQNADSRATATCRIQSEAVVLAPGDTVDAWFIEGTLLELYSDGVPEPSLQVTERILEDSSFCFERGRWTRPPADGPADPGGLGELADRFLAAGPPAASARGAADQRAIVDEWIHFLNGYTQWSRRGFPTAPPAEPIPDPSHRTVQEARSRLVDSVRQLRIP